MSQRASPLQQPGAVVYLDYAATTPVDSRVAAVMAECLTREGVFGNPGSASHEYGDLAHARVEAARDQVAWAVGAAPADIVWTSGATEANNLALFGVAHYHRARGRHIVTLRTEHKAVLDPCRELERRGWRVTYLTPDLRGLVEPAQLADALRPDTVLVSVMHVNNEIGVIQDIAALAAVCAEHGGALFHVDAAQSMGKCALEFTRMGIDLMSLSAHKAYGPKGVGALLVSRARGVQLQPVQFGGGQERNLRSGTVATHQVVGMGAACALAEELRGDEVPRIEELRDRLWREIEMLGGTQRNGASAHSVAHLLNVSFDGVEGESLIAAVRSAMAVSTGSACTSAVQEPSYVLRALGRDERLAESSLRFSLGRFSTIAEMDAATAAITRVLSHLRRISGEERNARAPGLEMSSAPAMAAALAGPRYADLRHAGRANYSELTWRHFGTAGNAGVLSGGSVRRGAAGSRSAGTWVQFDLELRLDAEGSVTIAAIRFLAYACPHVIAVADWIASQAVGMPAGSALPEDVFALQQRFGVPVDKRGRLLIVEDAWIAALSPPP